MIIVENLKKTYITKTKRGFFKSEIGKVEALKGVNLKIEQGQIIGLLGINGAGKTTIIKTMSTLLSATSGSITIDGELINKNETAVRKKINMIVGGERMLYWNLTAKENLKYFGRLYNIPEKELDIRVNDLIEFLDLKDRADEPVEKFSKGMKQRVQIARGLINNPKYVFLDEPTLGLDVMIAKELRTLIKKMAKEENKGILLTSHYLNEVEELCDYIYIINKGQNIIEGTPKDLINKITKNQKIFNFEVNSINNKLKIEIEKFTKEFNVTKKDDKIYNLEITADANSKDSLFNLLAKHSSILNYSQKEFDLENAIIRLTEELHNETLN